MNERSVEVGDNVGVGDQMGTVGTTGNASPGADGLDVHLHIQVGPELNNTQTSVNNSTAIDPNLVYDGVKFESADPSDNTTQASESVIKTVTNENGESTRYFQKVGTQSQGIKLLDEVQINGGGSL